jgi:protein-L-isoaspartate(D-aspartate) O-methyltransferase
MAEVTTTGHRPYYYFQRVCRSLSTPSSQKRDPVNSVQDHRRSYAAFVVKSVGSSNERLVAAFESIEREHYVGAGPWHIFAGSAYIPTPSDDPRLLYQDVLVGLAMDRGINNGQPTLHARCLDACAPVEGESVVHIGAGTGYYTAILAALVGSGGRVVGYELEADLAERAKGNLRHLTNVQIMAASGSVSELPKSDVIYVNAGATHPMATWLDAMNIGGRLIFPLTPNEGFGGMLLVTRRGASSYAASMVCRAAFIPCIGARDDATAKALTAAMDPQSIKVVKSLHRDSIPDSTAWCVGAGWWLSTAEAA